MPVMYTKTRLIISAGLKLISLVIVVACASKSTMTATVEASPTITLSITLPTSLPPTLLPLTPSPISFTPTTSAQTGPMYSFENFANGWTCQAYYSTMACIQASNSTDEIKDGQFSLEVQMNLIGDNEQNNRGEVWVDMRNYPPSTAQGPFSSLNLSNHTITMWVYAPTGAIGDTNRPNGLQIFVKDIHYNGSYSAWENVVENEWVQLSFTVNNSVVENGYMEQGFDPTQIVAVGLKMGAGKGSIAGYQGSIYVDTIDW